ncbi:MAG: CcmD family protein [Dehalococcoidia bacterium]
MALEFLFAGFAVFWAGLFVYVVFLQARLRGLQREVQHLEERLAEADAASAPALRPREGRVAGDGGPRPTP